MPHSHKSKLIRYLFVGGSTAFVDFAIFVGVLNLLNHTQLTANFAIPLYPEYIANGISLTCAFVYSFLLHRSWSFRSTGNPYRELIKSVLLVILNAMISSFCISFLSRNVGIDVKIAKIILQVFVAGWNYLIFNYLIYHSK